MHQTYTMSIIYNNSGGFHLTIANNLTNFIKLGRNGFFVVKYIGKQRDLEFRKQIQFRDLTKF